MKIKRSTLLPILLVIYLGVMAWLGLPGLESGQTKLGAYIATIAVSLGVIVLLHFFLRRREQQRKLK